MFHAITELQLCTAQKKKTQNAWIITLHYYNYMYILSRYLLIAALLSIYRNSGQPNSTWKFSINPETVIHYGTNY